LLRAINVWNLGDGVPEAETEEELYGFLKQYTVNEIKHDMGVTDSEPSVDKLWRSWEVSI